MFVLIPASKEAINEKKSATCGMCDKYYNNIPLKNVQAKRILYNAYIIYYNICL